MRARVLPVLVLLGWGALVACSSGPDPVGGNDASLPSFCVDPAALQSGTASLMLAPDAGQLVNTQHVTVGACDAYILYWRVGSTYSDELITNCAPPSLGGSAASQGFAPDCLLETSGSGGVDSAAVTMSCVCCAGGECGRYCHPVSFEGGGGLVCASYSYDFQSSQIQDPTTQPNLCDCSGF